MHCVRSIAFSFLLNGEVFGKVWLGMGIRQGDPFFPFLFLFYTKGFSYLKQQVEMEKQLAGLKFGTRGLSVSHMLFAGDNFVFMDANREAG